MSPINGRKLMAICQLCLWIQIALGDVQYGSVYMESGKARFVAGSMDKNAAAMASYNKALLSKGWNILDIKAGYGKAVSNNDLMYAAGYIEGVMSAEEIWNHYQNMKTVFLPVTDPTSNETEVLYRKYFTDQETWTNNMIKKHGDSDPYWRHVSYIVSQFNGLTDGYQATAKTGWVKDRFVTQMLNAVGDLIDLRHALKPGSRPKFDKMNKDELLTYIRGHGHCSALVKVTGAYENLFMAHSSWFVYQATLRIYKHYDFNLKDSATAAKGMSFSSYPGFLESLDDFYLMNSGLVMLQTTNNIFNTTLYDLVTSQSLLAWQRVRISNHMSHSGKEWKDTLSLYNSGTYNNQYMIIDLKRIHLQSSIDDGALWIVEQIPGLVSGSDESTILRTGYWPSYNVPFFEDIYNKSGYPDIVKTQGLDMSYQLAPRAKIFRRDQDDVLSIDTMKDIMRYNNYKVDPYAEKSPWNAICSRGDLDPTNPRADGCYDSKVTDYQMALQRQSFAINGPSIGTNLPTFSWSGKFANVSHHGLPSNYNFTWVSMQPSL